MDKIRQEKMPLAGLLASYTGRDRVSLHVPGHKGRIPSADASFSGEAGLFFSMAPEKFLRADITEIDGFDDLHNPTGVIREAQQLAADLFGADETFFLVNGTTSGVVAAVAAAAYKGEPVLVARDCHESVTRGLILSGAQPIYIDAAFDEEQGIPAGIHTESVRTALDLNPGVRALVLTHPSYYGTYGRLEEIVALCHSREVAVIADEAHGAQLYFSGQEEIPAALAAGCDISVQSTHKMLGSLTQSSMLHVRGERIDRRMLRSLISLMNSTSPSYLLMASLDAVRHEMALRGEEIWREKRKLAAEFAERIERIQGIRCVREFTDAEGCRRELEGCRLLFSAEESGIGGRQLAKLLAEEHRIDAELWDGPYVLAVVGSGTERSDLLALEKALKDISASAVRRRTGSAAEVSLSSVGEAAESTDSAESAESASGRFQNGEETAGGQTGQMDLRKEKMRAYRTLKHRSALSPRDAFFSPAEIVSLEEAAGRIASNAVSVYPPGIPVLYPGEIISEEIRDYILNAARECEMHGMAEEEGERLCIRVVTERQDALFCGMLF